MTHTRSKRQNTMRLVFFFFFVVAFPLSPYWSIRYLAVGLFFPPFFFLMCGGAPGYFPRSPTPTLPLFSFFLSGQHNTNTTQHSWEAHPAWDLNPADFAVVSEECLSLLSTTLPSAPERHTHTSMARRRFLPWKKASPFGEIRTH
jgi:hypothetical protein